MVHGGDVLVLRLELPVRGRGQGRRVRRDVPAGRPLQGVLDDVGGEPVRAVVGGAAAAGLVRQDEGVRLGVGGLLAEDGRQRGGAVLDLRGVEDRHRPVALPAERGAVDELFGAGAAREGGVGVAVGDVPTQELQDLGGLVGVEGDLGPGVVEPGAAELRVEGDEEPPLEVLVVDPQPDGLEPLLGGLLGLLQHIEPLVDGGDRHDAAVVAEQSRLLQHVLAVEAELYVDVEREGVEGAVDDGALPQLGVEVLLPYAVLREQVEVPGVQEAAGREAGDAAEVHHAEVRGAVAGRGHGELGVEGAAPLEGGVLDVDVRVVLTERVQHRDHVVAVAAAEEVPVADAGARVGGERVGARAEGGEAEAAGDGETAGAGQ